MLSQCCEVSLVFAEGLSLPLKPVYNNVFLVGLDTTDGHELLRCIRWARLLHYILNNDIINKALLEPFIISIIQFITFGQIFVLVLGSPIILLQ